MTQHSSKGIRKQTQNDGHSLVKIMGDGNTGECPPGIRWSQVVISSVTTVESQVQLQPHVVANINLGDYLGKKGYITLPRHSIIFK